jgi:hypothetical protein
MYGARQGFSAYSIIDALAYISIYQTVLDAEADINFTWGDD